MTYATTWMNLENTMPSESQPTKDRILYDSRIGRTVCPEQANLEMESRTVVARARENED